MKRIIVFILLFTFVTGLFSVYAASEFQQRQLIKRYVSTQEIYWDDITRENRDLIDENLYDMVKDYYYKLLLRADEEAREKNKRRDIPSRAFLIANLADYIARKIGKKSELRYHLAMAHFKDGRPDVAADICNTILMTEPKNVKVAALQAKLFLHMNMPHESMETYKKILKIDEDNQEALYRLGTMYVKLGQYEKAVEKFKKLLKINPDNKEAKRFVDLYEGNVKTSPGKKIDDTAIHHFLVAERLFSEGKYGEAAEEYSLAIEEDPEFYRAYVYLGESLIRQKKYSPAEKVLENAIALEPDKPEAYHFLGLALEKRYNFDPKLELLKRAVENYEKALQVDPDYADVKTDLTRARKRLEKSLN